VTAESRNVRLLLACLLLLALVPAPAAAAGGPDRLERFHALAASRLGPAELGDDVSRADAVHEIYGILDDEIVESLATGSVFSSVEFLQDRLDAFTETWGATVARVVRAGKLIVGTFQLSEEPPGASVRVYGPLGGAPALLEAISRDGKPRLYPLPPAGGAAQFLVAWEGQPSDRGIRPLRLDQFREDRDRVRLVWSTAQVFAGAVLARGYTVNGPEIRVRREVRYPGWVLGCEGQTEEEDVYRLAPGTTTFARAARHELDAWHREFHVSVVAPFFAALAAGDRSALAGLVPDPTLRDKLPPTLEAAPACDATESAPVAATGSADGSSGSADGRVGPSGGIAVPGARSNGAVNAGRSAATPATAHRTGGSAERERRVSVAASGAEGPWRLTFERAAGRWRLVRAQPVLQ
jgi:hypothetical protein